MSRLMSLSNLFHDTLFRVRLNPVKPDGVQGEENLYGAETMGNGTKVTGRPDFDTYECQTCQNRKYQDGSNDPGVSFKTPTRISPESAPAAIRAHEAEHVSHAWAKAQKEDQEIVSQSVSYHTDICPECGKTYMSGGTTRTVFRTTENADGTPAEKGRYLDLVV